MNTIGKKTVIFLEGRSNVDYKFDFQVFEESDDYEVSLINNLYEDPTGLEQLPELNPDYLYIGTTGMYHEYRQELIEKFKSLNYIPKAVIFQGENSIMAYLKLAREIKKFGTKFYQLNGFDAELYEISWI